MSAGSPPQTAYARNNATFRHQLECNGRCCPRRTIRRVLLPFSVFFSSLKYSAMVKPQCDAQTVARRRSFIWTVNHCHFIHTLNPSLSRSRYMRRESFTPRLRTRTSRCALLAMLLINSTIVHGFNPKLHTRLPNRPTYRLWQTDTASQSL